MPPATIPDRALSNLVDDIYSHLKSLALIQIKKADIQRKLPALRTYIDNVRLVKTLWQIDKPVDVESFYCDSHVLVRRNRTAKQYRRRLDRVSDLNSRDNFVVQGIAGQGKSILLRHLFINEAQSPTRIPVFIELRRIQHTETLSHHIATFLDILGLPTGQDLIRELLKSGKFIFFLDGFDEIPDHQVLSILNELEYLASISPSCQFIVTSRPRSPITLSPQFNVVVLDNLQRNEYQTLIRKLSDTKKYGDAIIARIKGQQPAISELLCTPLLVTLLLISYKSYQTIPTQLSDFYESIFISLLQRHDGTKPAFTRSRRCSLNDNQYRQVFDAFCFESKRHNTTTLDYQQVYSSVEKAMSLLDLKQDAESYIKDIKNITCLLLEESNQYRFIHSTVQEYYGASFVRSLPEGSAIKFYQACLDDRTAIRWNQELAFLGDIDPYRHARYFVIPMCSKNMGYQHELDPSFVHPPEMSLDRTKNILGSWELTLEYDGQPHCAILAFHRALGSFGADPTPLHLLHLYLTRVMQADCAELISNALAGNIPVVTTQPLRTTSNRPNQVTLTARDILDAGFLTTELQAVAQEISYRAYTQWQQAISYLSRRDAIIEALDLR